MTAAELAPASYPCPSCDGKGVHREWQNDDPEVGDGGWVEHDCDYCCCSKTVSAQDYHMFMGTPGDHPPTVASRALLAKFPDPLSAADVALLNAPPLSLPTFALEQRVLVTGPDDTGDSGRVGQEGVVAFATPGDDWVIDFGDGWGWYAGKHLKAVK